MHGDWRNRTEHCEVWKALFTALEEELLERSIVPLSQAEGKRSGLEHRAMEEWMAGRAISLSALAAAWDEGAMANGAASGD